MPADRMPVKRLSFVRLRADLARLEALERWFGEHAEIVRALPEVLEYTVDAIPEDAVAAVGYDAVATLRFETRAAMRRSLEAPRVSDALKRTRDDFAESVEVVIVDEHVLVDRLVSSTNRTDSC